jgi:anhydro-N-acetylmuramic acid kinase
MNYRAIGLMSGSSLDGLDIACAAFEVSGGGWSYRIEAADCIPYPDEWREGLRTAIGLSALDYLLLHSEYGHYLGRCVNAFIADHDLHYRVSLVASHGHTTFHLPPRMTGQIGCGAAIAAETGLPVVTDLRALDVALGGQGAPIVPMGEKLLFPDTHWFLNLGGIANLTASSGGRQVAFDACPANRVLNMLAAREGLAYDEDGRLAASGSVDAGVLAQLDALPYYDMPYPKSLANDFGTDIVHPILAASGLSTADALRTCVEHVARQIAASVARVMDMGDAPPADGGSMLVTGGGALNGFLVHRIDEHLQPMRLRAEAAEPMLANYKEALIMALLGILRWREEATTLPEVTGASRAGIGGALWMGHS